MKIYCNVSELTGTINLVVDILQIKYFIVLKIFLKSIPVPVAGMVPVLKLHSIRIGTAAASRCGSDFRPTQMFLRFRVRHNSTGTVQAALSEHNSD
jgi:hypothetical protein